MAFINAHRSLTTKTELDIFATPPTQNSIDSGTTLCVRPISSLTDASPIEFLVPGSGDEYIDLAHTTLHLVAKIIPDDPDSSLSSEKKKRGLILLLSITGYTPFFLKWIYI